MMFIDSRIAMMRYKSPAKKAPLPPMQQQGQKHKHVPILLVVTNG